MGQRLPGNLFGALCVLFCSLTTQAQLVFIPDTNFRELLSLFVPGAIDANGFLDPQHPEALGQVTMEFEWPQMFDGTLDPVLPLDLTGIDALTNLQRLTINCCHFDGMILGIFDDVPVTVPAWPASLRELNLWFGTYANMPPWPDALEELKLDLPSGPSALPTLPAALERISLKAGEDLVSLPELPAGIHHVTLEAPVDYSVPALPSSIDTLSITGFAPAGVTAWPDALRKLTLTNINTWTAVPAWPALLQDVDIQGASALTSLPNWSATVVDLSISGCAVITGLPDFPSALVSLDLQGLAALNALPDYPATLEVLELGSLGVAALPAWPPLVDHIRITTDMPNLVELPDFPNEVRFITTYGDFPALTALPAWPDSLRELTMYSSSINEFPPFPAHLTGLAIADMPNLHCLPLLPESLGWFFNQTPVDCLPNIPSGLSSIEVGPEQFIPVTTSMLCNVLNSTCEFLNPVATGSVYVDQNANGVHDGGEPGYPFAKVNAQPGNITYGVPSSGSYQLPLPLDQYTLTASSDNPYVLGFAPASHDALFVNASDVDASNDFAVVLQPDVQDLRIDLNGPWGRPGFEDGGVITYDNIGSTSVDGSIIFQLDAQQSWVESTPPPTSVNGNTITWDVTDLQIGGSGTISLTVFTDLGVPLGTPLQHTATAGPLANDGTPGDNTAVSNTEVIGSYDPNDKRVEPATLTPTEVAAGEEVVYTIRFQNTGTYQADRVIITDELSSELQWSTLRLINSSHPCTWVLSNEGLLRFTFDPIFLPDSTSDEPGSHGYVRFAMKPVSDLMLGESVSNTASIHFDFNEAVVTNEAVFAVETSTAVQDLTAARLIVWPNPVEDVLRIEGAVPGMVDVLDVTGRAVLRERIGSPSHLLDVRTLAPGRYTLRIAASGMRAFIKR